MVIYYYTVFIPKVWDNVLHKGQYDYLIPLILGMLLFTPLRAQVGLGEPLVAGLPARGGVGAAAFPRPWRAASSSRSRAAWPASSSRCGRRLEHHPADRGLRLPVRRHDRLPRVLPLLGGAQGPCGRLAYFGRLCIMAGFGASFGYTVMARVSLLIGRVQFMTRDCRGGDRTPLLVIRPESGAGRG